MKTVMLECSRSINIMFLDYTNKNHAFGSVSEDKYHFRKENCKNDLSIKIRENFVSKLAAIFVKL